MSATVPTFAEFNALNTTVKTLQTSLAAQTTQLTALSDRVTALEGASGGNGGGIVGIGEPVYMPANGDGLIYQDNMDRYTTNHEADLLPGFTLQSFWADNYPNNYAIILGRGGVGKALRLVYINGNGERFLYHTKPENYGWYTPANAGWGLTYWFRVSKNGGPGGGPGFGATNKGMKWVEFWNLGGNARSQLGVTAGDATTGPLWHLNPASRGMYGFQPVGPYWNQLNDNQWHRQTILYQPASVPGASDGIARMWIDGTKIVDVSAQAAGITPPGGTKMWCTLAEVQQMDTAQVGQINLGEYMNGAAGDGVTDLPMAVDFDDFIWWRLGARL